MSTLCLNRFCPRLSVTRSVSKTEKRVIILIDTFFDRLLRHVLSIGIVF